MRSGFSMLVWSAVLLVLGGAFAPELRAQGMQRSTRGATSSETNSAEIFTRLKGLDEKDDGLLRLDEELNKSLQPFTRRESMDSTVPSTYQVPRMPVTKILRSKEELERSKGWVWDAEESISGGSREDNALFPGFTSRSAPDKKTTSRDAYSNSTKADRFTDPDARSRNNAGGRGSSDSDYDNGLTGGVGEAAKNLHRSLKSRLEMESVGSIFNTPSTRSSVADFFGQSTESGPTPAEVQAHKAYMDEYQKILGGGSSVDPANVNVFKSAAVPASTGKAQGLDTLPGSSRSDGLAFTSGASPSAPVPATLPDVNADLLNQWNPMYTPPKVDLPKPAPFFPTPMQVPRRPF